MTTKARRRFFSFVGVVVVIVALAMLALPSAPREVSRPAPPDPLVVKGALHIHTIRSDGGGTVDDVAEAARAAGLQFVVITDHGDGRGLLEPSYRSGVLCIDGSEISSDEGHVAAFGLRPAEYPMGGAARDVIDDVHRLGGMAIAAHPTSPRKELAWRAWDTPFDGIEWLNADSEWRDEGSMALLRTAFGYVFRPAPAVALTFDRPVTAFERADGLASRRPMVVLAGHDAHARIAQSGPEGYGRRGVPMPSYRSVFETFAVRAVLDSPMVGTPSADAALILRALKHGRVFTGVDALATPGRFAFSARSGGASVSIGGRLIPAGPVTFTVDVEAPRDATIVLLHNGRQRASGPAPRLEYNAPAAPGAYRAEVHLPGAPGDPPIPWIVSSSLYVGLPAVPPPPESYGTSVRLDSSGWVIEHSPSSSAGMSVTPDGAELRFQLGARGTNPYAALVLPVAPPNTARALSFAASADRPMRISVQLRSPEGGREGQRWRRSIFLDAAERTFVLPLDAFDAVPGTRTPLGQAPVDSLLFVADTVNTEPGTGGQFGVRLVAWKE